LIKVKGENESYLGRSLSFIFGRFFGRCSKKKRDKRGSNESVKSCLNYWASLGSIKRRERLMDS